jgi:hypothetical protein
MGLLFPASRRKLAGRVAVSLVSPAVSMNSYAIWRDAGLNRAEAGTTHSRAGLALCNDTEVDLNKVLADQSIQAVN